MAGFDGNDTLYGGGGRDEILGVGGNDTLFGGQGIDTLNGSVGNDWLFGGTGEDVLITGEGRDVVSFAPEQATSLDGNCFGAIDRVTDFDTNRDKIDLKDFGYSCLEDFYEAGGKIVGTATGTYIYFDGTGQGVFLENVSARTIDESDFVF